MIDKILNKFGYIRVSSIDEQKIMELYANTVKDFSLDIDDKTKELVIEDMKKIENISELFDAYLVRDMRSYFSAHTDREREAIRGSYNRTLNFKSLMQKQKPKPMTRITGIRYGA